MADKRIKATIHGRNRWAFYKIGRMEGRDKDDSAILDYIMTRILAVDRDLVEEHGLGVSEYQAARESGHEDEG